MKKFVSISNNDIADKKQNKNASQNSLLKPGYFTKFSNETLFYIFYYMPRDTLQIYAAEELYKRKWKYHTEYSVWFLLEQTEGDLYFNQNEWKIMKFVYGTINLNAFLPESEINRHKTEKN